MSDVLRSINLSLMAKFMGPFLGLTTIGLISKLYGPESVGFYTSFLQLLIIFGIFCRYGSDFVLMKSLSQYSVDVTNLWIIKEVCKIFFPILICTVVILFLGFDQLNWPVINIFRGNDWLILTTMAVSTIYVFLISILIARNKIFSSIVLQSIVTPLIILLVILFLPKENLSILHSLLFGFLASLIVSVFYLISSLNSFVHVPCKKPCGYFQGFSISISEAVFYNSDIFLLSFFVSFVDLAAYALASRLSIMYGFYVQMNNAAIVGDISSMLARGEKTKLLVFRKKFITRNLFFSCLYVIALIVAGYLARLMLGLNYEKVFFYTILLSVPGFLGCLYGFTTTFRFLISDRYSRLDGNLNILFMLFYVSIFLLFANFFGISGAIFVTVVFKSIYYLSFNSRLKKVLENYDY